MKKIIMLAAAMLIGFGVSSSADDRLNGFPGSSFGGPVFGANGGGSAAGGKRKGGPGLSGGFSGGAFIGASPSFLGGPNGGGGAVGGGAKSGGGPSFSGGGAVGGSPKSGGGPSFLGGPNGGGGAVGGGAKSGSAASVVAHEVVSGVQATPPAITYWYGTPNHEYQWDSDILNSKAGPWPVVTFTGSNFTVTSAPDPHGKVELSRFYLISPDGESHQISCAVDGYQIPPPATVLSTLPCNNIDIYRDPKNVTGNDVSVYDLLIDNDQAGVHKRYPRALKSQALDALYAKGVCPRAKAYFLSGNAVADPYTREGECYLSADSRNTIAVLGVGMKEVARITVNGEACALIGAAKAARGDLASNSALLCDAPPIPYGEDVNIVVTSADGESSTVRYGASALYSPHSKVYPTLVRDIPMYNGVHYVISLDPAKKLSEDEILHDAVVSCPAFDVNWYGWTTQSACVETNTDYADYTTYVNRIKSPLFQAGVRIYYVSHVVMGPNWHPAPAAFGALPRNFQLTANSVPDLPGQLGGIITILGKPMKDGSVMTPGLKFDAFGPQDKPGPATPSVGAHDDVVVVDALAVNPDGTYGVVPDIFHIHFKTNCTSQVCSWSY